MQRPEEFKTIRTYQGKTFSADLLDSIYLAVPKYIFSGTFKLVQNHSLSYNNEEQLENTLLEINKNSEDAKQKISRFDFNTTLLTFLEDTLRSSYNLLETDREELRKLKADITELANLPNKSKEETKNHIYNLINNYNITLPPNTTEQNTNEVLTQTSKSKLAIFSNTKTNQTNIDNIPTKKDITIETDAPAFLLQFLFRPCFVDELSTTNLREAFKESYAPLNNPDLRRYIFTQYEQSWTISNQDILNSLSTGVNFMLEGNATSPGVPLSENRRFDLIRLYEDITAVQQNLYKNSFWTRVDSIINDNGVIPKYDIKDRRAIFEQMLSKYNFERK